MIGRLLRGQEGVALILVLAFVALAVPLVSSALGLASTLSIDSRVKTGRMYSQYATMGGVEHAIYRLVYEDGYAESFPPGTSVNYVVVINGKDVTVAVTKTTEPPPPPTVPSAETGRELRTSKNVQPKTASPGVNTTFNYKITVTNSDTEDLELTTIYDLLPSGFSYVSGSSTGITTTNPVIMENELKWESLAYTIPSGGDATLNFQASATPAEGVYCNEAYVDPGGQSKSTTGKTAKIVVGSPSSNLCPDPSVILTKSVDSPIVPGETAQTFTYTISVENNGSVTLNVGELRDLLPAGFNYVLGSSSGMASVDPSVTNTSGREQLSWGFSPKFAISPGQTETQVFQVTATPDSGDYYNEVWAVIDEIGYEVYTWPTANVSVMGVFETSATDGKTTVNSVVWLGTSSYILDSWTMK